MPTDIDIYCNCMERVRFRINFVQTVLSGQIKIGSDDQTLELIFVQFRKSLEEIAFASLSANKEKYSEVYENFSQHWNAKRMIEALHKLNPNFYPVPSSPLVQTGPGKYRFGPQLTDGFLTKDDFVFLYNCSSAVLHTRNPYREGNQTIDVKHSVEEWVNKIQKLLSCHLVVLLNGQIWIVNVPGQGRVEAYAADRVKNEANL